jgi:hypothetical protein
MGIELNLPDGLLSPSLAAQETEKGRTDAERPVRTASV